MTDTAHKVKKLEDGDFEYRGVMFTRTERLRGYSDYYRTIGRVRGAGYSAKSQRELTTKIDQAIDQ